MAAPNPYASPVVSPQPGAAPSRTSTWAWYVCILLLFGTVVNYMDRLTANTLSSEIIDQFGLTKQQYGYLELGFGLAFATGCTLFGILVDRYGVYYLYPLILLGWSAMGFLTGLSENYTQLLILRTLLGLFEAGHFPCGLKTVQLLLSPRDRMMGNSLLQSGTAVGAIAAPQAIKILMAHTGNWRTPFLVIGAAGCVWILFWFASVRARDLREAAVRLKAATLAEAPAKHGASLWDVLFTKKFLALAIMVICINQNWHLFRVWLPLFLQESRGYEFNAMLDFTTGYYIAADIGVLCAGAAATWLTRRHWSVYSSRLAVFAFCACLTTMTTVAAFLPAGTMLLVSLLAVAFGGLGCFSSYYSLTQDLSPDHQGKISGILGTCTWCVTPIFHPLFGLYLDYSDNNYDVAIGVMGWLPMISLVALLVLWRPEKPHEATAAPMESTIDDMLAPASTEA